jgi:hypothetical protein
MNQLELKLNSYFYDTWSDSCDSLHIMYIDSRTNIESVVAPLITEFLDVLNFIDEAS